MSTMSDTDARARLAIAISQGVQAVPGVTRMTTGAGVRAVTHYAAGTVTGVVLAHGRVEVHVAVDQLPLQPVADAVHAATRAAVDRVCDGSVEMPVVLVCVDDVEITGPPAPRACAPAASRQSRVRVAQAVP